ncbi:hypothetical protein F5146DRAFT_1005268 [Armillaria mellea]|nr:hypothetical protein F5146DRAFT_1005268 [Armillaria mellea]
MTEFKLDYSPSIGNRHGEPIQFEDCRLETLSYLVLKHGSQNFDDSVGLSYGRSGPGERAETRIADECETGVYIVQLARALGQNIDQRFWCSDAYFWKRRSRVVSNSAQCQWILTPYTVYNAGYLPDCSAWMYDPLRIRQTYLRPMGNASTPQGNVPSAKTSSYGRISRSISPVERGVLVGEQYYKYLLLVISQLGAQKSLDFFIKLLYVGEKRSVLIVGQKGSRLNVTRANKLANGWEENGRYCGMETLREGD